MLIERDLPHTESARAEAGLYCARLAEAAQALLTSDTGKCNGCYMHRFSSAGL